MVELNCYKSGKVTSKTMRCVTYVFFLRKIVLLCFCTYTINYFSKYYPLVRVC